MRFRVWNTSSLVILTADYINTAVFCTRAMRDRARESISWAAARAGTRMAADSLSMGRCALWWLAAAGTLGGTTAREARSWPAAPAGHIECSIVPPDCTEDGCSPCV
eukprot:COSAG06_NODE_2534_length_6710_cov_23.487521_1_plen_107_part_00